MLGHQINGRPLSSRLRSRLNVERLLVYINPRGTLRDFARFLSCGYGSRQPWSADVFLRQEAAAN